MSCLRPAAVRRVGSGISRRTSGIEAEKRIVRRRVRSGGKCSVIVALLEMFFIYLCRSDFVMHFLCWLEPAKLST